jgi:hypothetical protein
MSTTHETPCTVHETILCIFKTNHKETLQKSYKTAVTSTLLYGCENWSLNKLHVGSETAEMTYLRSITRYALYNHKTNQEIRNHRPVDDYMNMKYQATKAYNVLKMFY